LRVGDVLFAISEARLTLTASKTEDTLKVFPAERLTSELAAAIKEHKAAIIRIMREDEEMRRTGNIQSSGRSSTSHASSLVAMVDAEVGHYEPRLEIDPGHLHP
jgi:L-aminopeptidase/D-esterase-like protein